MVIKAILIRNRIKLTMPKSFTIAQALFLLDHSDGQAIVVFTAKVGESELVAEATYSRNKNPKEALIFIRRLNGWMAKQSVKIDLQTEGFPKI